MRSSPSTAPVQILPLLVGQDQLTVWTNPADAQATNLKWPLPWQQAKHFLSDVFIGGLSATRLGGRSRHNPEFDDDL